MSSTDYPLVSFVIATRNEVRLIQDVVRSVLEQKREHFDLEVLVVDGRSSDGTVAAVEAMARDYPELSLIDNPGLRAPDAFNLGIEAARGEFVCIASGHGIYQPDYVSACLQAFDRLLGEGHENIAGVSGWANLKPAANSPGHRLMYWLFTHPFGCSSGSYRNIKEGFVHSLPVGIYKKNALLQVGGFDLALVRNQDNDLSQRLRAAGNQLYLTSATYYDYSPDTSLRYSFKYAFRNGFWNGVSLKLKPRSMRPYHFVPFVFVMALIVTLALLLVSAVVPLAVPFIFLVQGVLLLTLLAYFLVACVSTFQVAKKNNAWYVIFLPIVFFLYHVSYGLGTLVSLLRPLKSITGIR